MSSKALKDSAIGDAIGQLAGAIYFSKLDANSGFHEVKLAKESQELATFITPFGRCCFQRLPFGISSAPEYFQKQMAEILEGLPGGVNLIDDILVYGATKQEHDGRLHAVLERLVKAGVTLNRAKCFFCVTRVAFLGYVVDSSEIRPDPKNVHADPKKVQNEMDTPSSVADVRRFLGMINYLARFVSDLAEVSAPLRSLLLKDREWHWGTTQQKPFEALGALITSAQCVAKFDPKLRTIVSAGLGCVLIQVQPDGERRPVAHHSRSLTPTERRYAQIEKEALALTWVAERMEYFKRRAFLNSRCDPAVGERRRPQQARPQQATTL